MKVVMSIEWGNARSINILKKIELYRYENYELNLEACKSICTLKVEALVVLSAGSSGEQRRERVNGSGLRNENGADHGFKSLVWDHSSSGYVLAAARAMRTEVVLALSIVDMTVKM